MHWFLLPFTMIASMGNSPPAKPTAAHSPLVPSVVEGRVVDEDGKGLENVGVHFVDPTRLSGYVDANGCGTYHPQETVWTGPDGRFREQLTFTPVEWEVTDVPPDFEGPSEPQLVLVGKEVLVTLQRIRWIFHEGQVVDEKGVPVPQVRIDSYTSTDDTGHFQLKVHPRAPPATFRFRKMGFKPLLVPTDALGKVVLRERRTLVTLKLVDVKTKQPVESLYRISAYRGDELLSYCSAGDVTLTHEPAVGECTLDVEPGKVELRVEGVPVRKTIKVQTSPQEVTLEVPARPQ